MQFSFFILGVSVLLNLWLLVRLGQALIDRDKAIKNIVQLNELLGTLFKEISHKSSINNRLNRVIKHTSRRKAEIDVLDQFREN